MEQRSGADSQFEGRKWRSILKKILTRRRFPSLWRYCRRLLLGETVQWRKRGGHFPTPCLKDYFFKVEGRGESWQELRVSLVLSFYGPCALIPCIPC
jgi:hypothetical protein